MIFTPEKFFDLNETEHRSMFFRNERVWDVIKEIEEYLKVVLVPELRGPMIGLPNIGDKVFVGKGTVVEPGVYIKGPAWIGENSVIRQGAYIRENVIIGNNCTVGNSCEIKNSILFNGAQVPHFNYVGDSILGHKAHLGAGVILSNVRLDNKNVTVKHGDKKIDSGLRKFGAIIGDHCEIGCNSVLNPGSVLGKKCMLYPLTSWTGFLAEGSKVKTVQKQEIIEAVKKTEW
jgi:UDP-N-acetylglucosamine diphosphorylase / glucose-1-phosphate thymidylyltransferase / UDP-N-acetylgalactosamine diphosphorylase / glucosamine-1-phosphate N-acetyltransferase / galactosamine-1-phosphate N-acetyltransferase